MYQLKPVFIYWFFYMLILSNIINKNIDFSITYYEKHKGGRIMSNNKDNEVVQAINTTSATSETNTNIENSDDTINPTDTQQETATPIAKQVVKKKMNYKKLGLEVLVAITIIGVASGGAYMMKSKLLDKKIEAQKQQMDKDTEAFFKEQNGTITPVEIPEEELAKAVNIEATLDYLPQELVDEKEDRVFKNDKGWMLVDTDGDLIGDSYWDVSVDDVKNGICGRMYLYSPVNRRYKQIKVQDAVPAKKIKEKWISVLDKDQVIHPQFLLPIQLYQHGKGTILDWSQVDKVASDDN